MNNPADQWLAAAAVKWGKFDARPGPLICWEPSDQTDVQNVYKNFSATGSDHADGVLIASNTDPAMFQVQHFVMMRTDSKMTHLQVYAAEQSLAALNSPLPVHDNATSSGRVRIATAIEASLSVKSSRDTPTSTWPLATDVFDSASRFTVVCTLSEGLAGTVMDYVSETAQQSLFWAFSCQCGFTCNRVFLLQILVDISSPSEPLPQPLAIGSLPLPPLPAVGQFQFGILLESDGDNLTLYVAVGQHDVTVFAVALNVTGSSVVVALQGVYHFGSLSQAQLSTLSLSFFHTNNSSSQIPICTVLAYSAPPFCTVVVEERCGNTSSLSTCVTNTTDASVLSSSIAGFESLSGRVHVVLYSMSHNLQLENIRHHLNGSAQTQAASVYGAVLLISDADHERSWVHGNERLSGFDSNASNVDEPLYLYAGDNPSVTLLPIAGSDTTGTDVLSSVAFLMTHDSGYCPNSEVNNKRADRGVCDILPTTCEGSSVMNYAYGSVRALQQLLQQKEPLSPCHPSIVSR